MGFPTFLIIGAAKAGTTSLYRYLGQHPEVYVSPVKEPSFYSRNSEVLSLINKPLPVVADPTAYQALFNDTRARAVGEASTIYLPDPGAAECIRQRTPDAKFVVILRDPIDRCCSEYWMFVRDNRENRPIEAAIDAELHSPSINPVGYLGRGRYAMQLRRYFKRFDRSQIKVVLFDDLRANPIGLVREVLCFLGIESAGFCPDVSVRYNASGQPPHRALKPLLGKSLVTRAIRLALPDCLGRRAADVQEHWRSRALIKPALPSEQHESLANFYRDDVADLEELLGRDLGHWLENPTTTVPQNSQ